MDHGDMAQDALEREEEAWMKNRKSVRKEESSMFCEDCGATIPEPRRQAIEGVKTCLGCQTSRDRDLMMEHF